MNNFSFNDYLSPCSDINDLMLIQFFLINAPTVQVETLVNKFASRRYSNFDIKMVENKIKTCDKMYPSKFVQRINEYNDCLKNPKTACEIEIERTINGIKKCISCGRFFNLIQD
jgi:hypothetical protein